MFNLWSKIKKSYHGQPILTGQPWMISRVIKLFYVPFKMLYARMFPERYAKLIGVNLRGRVRIYPPSYDMFSAEPYLITLGDNVTIAGGTLFIPHDGATVILRYKIPDLDVTKPITVGDNVFIGSRCMIMMGVHIGNNVIIGAGSVVTKDIPDGSIAAGVPAKVIKTFDEYIEKAKIGSLHLGHLGAGEKAMEYKKIFKCNPHNREWG